MATEQRRGAECLKRPTTEVQKAGKARRQRCTAAESAHPLWGPDRIYLFGSWATGEADELSDVDLVVIMTTSAPFFDRPGEVARLLPSDFGAVDILVYTPEEFTRMKANGNAFAEMVEGEGVILYDTTRP